jgi:hypothetical protein
MAGAQWLAIVLGVYVAIVIAFETLVMVMGARQAARGLEPGEDWLAIATSDANGSRETIVAGVESDGQLYISANHWLRGWHRRALENPEIEVTRNGVRLPYRATAVSGAERERIVRDYPLPWAIRFLTGFPPRLFLRLDARPG